MDKRVVDVIWTTAREQGTPDVVVKAVLESLLPSTRLVPQQPKTGEDWRIGGCRIGGVPDLPQGVEWPRLSPDGRSHVGPVPTLGPPMSFLLQVNLAEVAFTDLEQLLPKSGMLYFFFHLDEVGDADVATVLFAQGTELYRTTAPLGFPADQLYRGFNLVPNLEWMVPSPYDLGQTDHLELWDELEDRVAVAQGYESPTTYGPGYAMHRLLGHAQFIQGSGTGWGERLLLRFFGRWLVHIRLSGEWDWQNLARLRSHLLPDQRRSSEVSALYGGLCTRRVCVNAGRARKEAALTEDRLPAHLRPTGRTKKSLAGEGEGHKWVYTAKSTSPQPPDPFACGNRSVGRCWPCSTARLATLNWQ